MPVILARRAAFAKFYRPGGGGRWGLTGNCFRQMIILYFPA
jgi:hypothetical protein